MQMSTPPKRALELGCRNFPAAIFGLCAGATNSLQPFGGNVLVLGVTGGHDANWCFVRDGVLLGAFEKERFSRVRHAHGEVVTLIPETLARLGLTIDDIDVVATSEPVFRDTGSGVRRLAGRTYRELNSWEHHTVELLGRIKPAISVPHHLAHAAYARYSSGFDET